MRMQQLIIGFSLMSLSLAAGAAPPQTEYKCFAHFADGTQKVLFAEGANVAEARSRLSEAPGRSRYDRRAVPVKLTECQKLSDLFRDPLAQRVDQATPR